MTDQLGDEYGAAIGSVLDAHKRYEAVCAAQGSESWAAQRAHDYLLREMEHRNRMRERHDAAAGERAEHEWRDVEPHRLRRDGAPSGNGD